MKLRLMGTLPELKEAVARLRRVFYVLEVSEPYRNRGESVMHRVYVEVDVPSEGRQVIQAEAEIVKPSKPGRRGVEARRPRQLPGRTGAD